MQLKCVSAPQPDVELEASPASQQTSGLGVRHQQSQPGHNAAATHSSGFQVLYSFLKLPKNVFNIDAQSLL
jgi:hypothetical protein